MSEHLRTAKILLGTCPEIKGTLNRCLFRTKEGPNIYGVRIFRVNTVTSRMRLLKQEQVYHCFFCVFWGGGGWTIFPQSGLIIAIISVHMNIVRSSICHPSKFQTSKFFFLDFQN